MSTNTGNVTLTNVVVSDPLVTMLGGPIASLAPGVTDSTTYTASYTITQQDIDAGVFSNQATATGTAPDASNVSDISGTSIDNDTPTDTPICQSPAIAIVKQATVSLDPTDNCYNVSVGGLIDYTFTITNQGNVPLSAITLTDALVTTAYVSGDDGDGVLQVLETWIFAGSYVVTQSDIDAGMVTNSATVSGISPINVTVTDISGDTIINDFPTITELCSGPSIAIIKIANYDCTDADGNPVSMPGDEILYTFSVKNTGGVTLNNILVTDPLVTVNGGPITLAPGEEDTTTFTAVYTITQNDIDNGFVENQARVEVCNQTNVSDGNCDGQVDYLKLKYLGTTQNATIKVIEHDGQTVFEGVVEPGEEFEFFGQDPPQQHFGPKIHIYINNTYTQLIHTSCSVAIGIGSVFGDFEVIDGTSRNGGPFIPVVLEVCDIEDLSDESSYSQDDPTITELCQDASIALVKTSSYDDGDCTAAVGDTIAYSFSVTNTGNVTLTNVVVSDPLVTILGGPIASLAPGVTDSTTYTASYTITQQDIDAGVFSNQATATATAPDASSVSDVSGTSIDNDTPTITDICQDASIALVKTSSYDDGDCTAAVGDTIAYSFSVTNTGNVTLTNVVVSDPLVTILGGPIASLAPGVTDSTTYTASYTITQQDIDAGVFSNQATATATAPDASSVSDVSGTSIDNDTPTITDICQDASIALVKTSSYDDGDCTAAVGDTIGYAFSVTNTGNVTLTNVVVSDPLVTILGGPIASLAPGVTDSTTYTASYTITQQDIDAGVFSNQATATATAPDASSVTDVSGTSIDNDTPTITDICQDASIALVKVGNYVPSPDSGGSGAQSPPACDLTINLIINDWVPQPARVISSGEVLCITETGTYYGTITVDAGGHVIVCGSATIFGAVTVNPGGNYWRTQSTGFIGSLKMFGNEYVTDASCSEPDLDCTSAVGDTISYNFSVVNTGNVTLSNVVVADPLVTMVGGPIASLAPGAIDTTSYTASYTVTQQDIDAGLFSNQATATATTPDASSVTDVSDDTSILEDDPTITILCATPSIALVKVGTYDGLNNDGDCIAAVGDIIGYAFSVTNTGSVTLTNVVVTDPLVTMLGGPIASLAPGATDSTTFTASYTITQQDIDAGVFSNQATATATATDASSVTDVSGTSIDNDTPTITDICQDANIALVKTSSYDDGDCTAAVGDTIGYSFSVTNTGNVTLTNVVVTDPLVTMLGGPIASLAPGVTDSTTYTASYSVTQQDIIAGVFSNQATATATAPDASSVTDVSGTSIDNDRPTITDICQDDAIALTKTGVFNDVDTSGCTTAGIDTVTYTFTVTNGGNTPLSSVSVTDPLLGGLLTATPSGDTNTNGVLDITETWVYVQDYSVTQSDIDTGSITNQATATGEGVNGTVSDDDTAITTLLESCLDAIALTKTGVFNDVDTSGCTTAGIDTVTYTFTVTNGGNTPLSSVSVTDPLLGGLLTATPSGDTNTNGVLDITETWVYVQDYSVTQSDIDTGSITNQATATGEGVNGTVSDDDTAITTLLESCLDAIALTKTGVFNDVDTSGCTTAGIDTVTYTFTVTNGGNTPLSSVSVTDPLLGGLLTATPSGDTNTNGVLDITETWVYVQDYSVTQSDIDTGSITNQATATGEGVNGTVSDDDTAITTLLESCLDAIALTKTGVFNDVDTSGCTTAGIDTVTYTFTVTNGGNTPLSSVSVTDPLLGGLLTATPSGDTNTNGVLDITETWVYVQDYSVTQSDIDTGSITNQATATGEGVNGTVSDDDTAITTLLESCLDAIALTKTGVFNDVDTSGCTTAGIDTVTYTFTVTNGGNTPLSSVSVTDPLLGGLLTATPSGDTNTNGVLDVTETWVYVQDYSVTQSDIDTGSITNQATATGEGVNGTVSDDDTAITTLLESCLDAIALTKTGVFNDVDTSGCTTAGIDTVTYTFTVTNGGNTPLSSVSVTDPLLGGLLTATPSGDTNTNGVLDVTETWVYVQDYSVTQSDIDTGSITNQATATGEGVNGTVSDDDTAITTLLESCLDAIALTKTGVFNDVDTSGCTTAGIDTVTYTFTVTNGGNTPLSSVSVTDPLLGGLLTATPSGDTNTNGVLDVTETWVYVQDYSVTQSDIDTGSITNQATATGEGVNGTVSDDDTAITTLLESCLDAIALTKTGVFNDVDTSGCTTAGIDTVTYTFTVTNGGNTPLSSVSVTDPLLGGLLTATPSGDTNTNGVLDVTETWVYVQDYSVTQSDIDTGSITNQATATGEGVNGTVSDDDTAITTLLESCLDAIALTKTGVFNDVDTSGCTTAGIDTVTYTFTVTNGGNTPLSSVSVTDPLLGGLLTATPSGDTNTNGVLDITETWVYVQDYSVTQSDIDTGSITNQATATGEGVNGTVSDDDTAITTLLESCLDAIALTKTGVFNDVDTSGCTTAGIDTVTYTFTVTNGGNTPLSSVSVTDPLLGGLLTATPSGDTNTNGVLDITETWVYVQDYSVTQSDIDTGSITNQATATGEGVNGTVSDDDTAITTLLESCLDAIALTKTGVFNDVDTSGCTTAGIDTVTYTFTVTNGGNTPLSSVSVTDPLLGGLLTATPSGDTNTNGVLDITETWVYVQDYSVTQSDIDTGSITNQATATGEGVNGTVSDDDTAITTLLESCLDAIAITKTGVFNDVDTSGCTTAGIDTVTYTFTVTNGGNTPLSSVSVTDPLLGGLLTATPSGDTNTNGVLDITETWVYVQDYSVTQSDIDTGSITNQATATGEGVNGTVSDDDTAITTLLESCIDAIALTKTGVFNDVDTSGCTTAGIDTVTYTFTVTNGGNTPLSSVSVTDPLLGGLLTATPSGDTNTNGVLDITETWVYVQDYSVTQSDIDTGSITNQATATGEGVNGTVSDDDTAITTLLESCIDAIALTKTGVFNDVDTSGCTTAGIDTVTYTFTVTNGGNTPLSSVSVTDPLLGGLLTATPSGDTNTNGVLDVTETWVYVQDYSVTQSDIDTGSITNQATATGEGVNGTVSDDDTAITTLLESCLDAIAITKDRSI